MTASCVTQQMNVYFYDFVCIEIEPLSKLAEMEVSLLFKLLGWDVSSDKETCFDSVAKVLGLKTDLSESRLGKIYFRNTDSRRDELFDSLSKILEEGRGRQIGSQRRREAQGTPPVRRDPDFR